jgi:hypothetical protein
LEAISQPQLLKEPLDFGDVTYTPEWVAKDMVDFFQPSGLILEPCAGDGVFLRFLPPAFWCEIQSGKDFFSWDTPVDWIIGNPPYGQFRKWFTHSFNMAENVCYLIPVWKAFSAFLLVKEYKQWGDIKHVRYYGTGSSLGWPLGNAIGAVHFQKGYCGPIYSSICENHGIIPQKPENTA